MQTSRACSMYVDQMSYRHSKLLALLLFVLSYYRFPQRQDRLVTKPLHPCNVLGRERARPVRADHDNRGSVKHG